jgi:hypothetical protein
VIIDKDGLPRWNPDRLDNVPDSDIEAYFAPVDAELELP